MSAVESGGPERLQVVTLDRFADAEETGSDPIIGDADDILIPQGGDVMFYGDGGAGKTTLAIDLGFHLAAGDPWLGIPIAAAVRVLLIELEGPRPLFRQKLRRKRDNWTGSAVGDRIDVLEAPWAHLTLDNQEHRAALADAVREHESDVVIAGPVTRFGMNEAGTLQQVRDFMLLVADVRRQAKRPIAVVLVHHENKGGAVSGAWEGSGDTLFHVHAQGHGRTRLFVQKARWSSSYHLQTLQLLWGDGESFTLEDKPEVTEDTIEAGILAAIRELPGGSWTKIRDLVTGNATDTAKVRDRLIAAGTVANTAGREGHFNLWLPDDPAAPRSDAGTGRERPVLASPERDGRASRSPVPDVSRNGERNGTAEPGVDPEEIERLAHVARELPGDAT